MSQPHELPRYLMMRQLIHEEPFDEPSFAEAVTHHGAFIGSGGGGGHWETLVTTANFESGIVLAVYVGPREADPVGIQAQLQHQRLEGLDLRGVQLPFACMYGISAAEQQFDDADLAGALITDSELTGASFQRAFLLATDFSRSEMQGCDFRGATLVFADFEHVDLREADFRGAKLMGVSFKGALLDGALGLDF